MEILLISSMAAATVAVLEDISHVDGLDLNPST